MIKIKGVKIICFLMLAIASLCICACATRSSPLPEGKITVPPGPKKAMKLYYNAKVAFQAGRFEDALKYYRKLVSEYAAVEKDKFYYPAGAEAHVAIGDCLFALGRYQQALEAYQKAEGIFPSGSIRFAAPVKIGDCNMKLGKYKEAMEAYLYFKYSTKLREDEELEIDRKIEAARKLDRGQQP